MVGKLIQLSTTFILGGFPNSKLIMPMLPFKVRLPENASLNCLFGGLTLIFGLWVLLRTCSTLHVLFIRLFICPL